VSTDVSTRVIKNYSNPYKHCQKYLKITFCIVLPRRSRPLVFRNIPKALSARMLAESLVEVFVFELADILDDGFAPAVDVHPLPVTNSVLVAGNVDHIALCLW
jgi:hypothetical protein